MYWSSLNGYYVVAFLLNLPKVWEPPPPLNPPELLLVDWDPHRLRTPVLLCLKVLLFLLEVMSLLLAELMLLLALL